MSPRTDAASVEDKDASGKSENAAAIDLLLSGFRELMAGDGTYKFIILRETSLDQSVVNGGDIDLLGGQNSVEAFVRQARQIADKGCFHFRIISRISYKVELRLYSVDGCQEIKFDLWIGLWQIDKGACEIRYSECASSVIEPEKAISRLPIELEACLYVHHLVAKRKNLDAPNVKARMEFYRSGCELNESGLARQLITKIQRDNCIDDECLRQAKSVLEMGLNTKFQPKKFLQSIAFLCAKPKQWLLESPRWPTAVAVMGCDGVGKTTLAKHVVKDSGNVHGFLKGKSLYRKSWLYKLSVILVRPLLSSPKEDYDDNLAIFAYLRASLALRLRLIFRRITKPYGLVIIDRTLADFLYVKRKTDAPRFCRGYRISQYVGPRIQVVHLKVGVDLLMTRKQEMTETGHAKYDEDMFDFHSLRSPTDYTYFRNNRSVTESAAAMSRILALM